METGTKDFLPQKKEVKLKNGLIVIVTTPTVGWWFDFIIPKARQLQWQSVSTDSEIHQKIIKDIQKGVISSETLSKMPLPLLDILLELVVYYVRKDAEWCKQNLDIVDFLAIINAFLEVCDIKRILDFFVQINQQIPIAALLGTKLTA
ncbi:MAG TPA: hypothetical protein ENI52_04020 [Thermoplasmata archaeon]|nr:hypothetical protein [Thermoplasmata archaeon]